MSEPLTLRMILGVVGMYFRVGPGNLLSRNRCFRYARPRQVVMYLAREHTNSTLAEIAASMRSRDHSTILWGERKVTLRIGENIQFARQVNAVERLLGITRMTYAAECAKRLEAA